MQRNTFKLLLNGIVIYLRNFIPLSRAMLFPVFGQIIGVVLILGPVYFYRELYLIKLTADDLQKNLLFILFGLILMIIPGFIIFLKAFWDYMVVMVSLNTMASDIIRKKKPSSFKIHNDAVKIRSKDYIFLLFILMGIWLIFLAAPFVILFGSVMVLNKILSTIIFALSSLTCLALLAIVSVYLSLSFQIFAFEAISPRKIIMKSYEMIENNFWRTVLLGFLLFVLTGAVIPVIFQELIKHSPILSYIVIPFEAYAKILLNNPMILEIINKYGLTISVLSKETALMSVGTTITMFTLPLGSACFTLLYFDLKSKTTY